MARCFQYDLKMLGGYNVDADNACACESGLTYGESEYKIHNIICAGKNHQAQKEHGHRMDR